MLHDKILRRLNSISWAKTLYEIAKYDPNDYSIRSDGVIVYNKSDWSEETDVGSPYDGELLSIDKYLQVEQRYVETAKQIAIASGCQYLTIQMCCRAFRSKTSSSVTKLLVPSRFFEDDKWLGFFVHLRLVL